MIQKRGDAAMPEVTEAPGVRVVGVGCSAGGLEALEAFFSRVPKNCAMAFAVVQHLDPTHASGLPDLLQRCTPLRVVEVVDRMPVEAGVVYVIPPDKDLSLLQGRLYLLAPVAPRGLRMAVDFFFRTLAADQRERAIGVVLSGMGSDGLLGLRAIKEVSGLTLAQDPDSAQAASMPKSAIDAGVVDIVALAPELPARIADYVKRAPGIPSDDAATLTGGEGALEKIVILLRDRCGNDFSLYKPSTLYRRIERRVALHHLSGVDGYVRYLRENPQELDILFKELLIGVTNFFRDPAVWETLKSQVIPELLAAAPAGRTFRAWVPACSSGEEAYTLAMVFRDAVEAAGVAGRFALQIYATDLDADAIDKARKGVYPKNIAADITPECLDRHFVAEGEHYRVAKEVRDMVIFAPQNIITDPPFTKLDLLSCRNLLIYFRPELQKRLLPLFQYALRSGGFLMLGTAETTASFSHLFEPVDGKCRIFRRLDLPQRLAELAFPASNPVAVPDAPAMVSKDRPDSLGELTDQLIQQTYAPPAVLVNADGDIIYISGRTGKYLEPAAGKVNVNIYAMAREGLREALTGVLRKALLQSRPIVLNGLQIGTNGGMQTVNVTVQGLQHPEALRGRVLIVFNDVQSPPRTKARGKGRAQPPDDALMQELLQMREALRVTREESQTAIEELRSANEELQSTNEELQSTNEELTTSKEEMQSLNEELQTVNAELQAKVSDLTWERNDMTNLLNSTQIATVFLDGGMKLRRFTALTTKLFKLIPGDVGRPLSDLVSDLDYPKLLSDAKEVLRTLVFSEKQVSTRDGRWFRVRIMPYRTQDNVIDGVVMTFTDITEIKQLEAELRAKGAPGPDLC